MLRRCARNRAVAFAVCLSLSYVASAAEPAPAQSAPATAPAAPGQVTVDRQAAERALERSLVSTGALLLRPGRGEIEPSLSFSRRELDMPVLYTQGTQQLLAAQKLRRNVFEPNVALRVGLPWDSQIELGLPYRVVDEQRVTEINYVPVASTSSRASGWGDLRIGIAKGLLTEGVVRPNLIGRLTWDTNTGRKDSDTLTLGGYGYNELQLSLQATKRQDPLVFEVDGLYQKTLNSDSIEQGDQFGFSLGVYLAASPDTSLRAALNQLYAKDVKIDGAPINGSSSLASSLLVGASSIVGQGKFLDFSVQVGLTDAAPAYVARIALSIPFGVPSV